MWKEGCILINHRGYHYCIKQWDTGSKFGINGGRISKLMIKRGGEIVCNYDRSWDIEPVDADTQIALEIILHSENHEGGAS